MKARHAQINLQIYVDSEELVKAITHSRCRGVRPMLTALKTKQTKKLFNSTGLHHSILKTQKKLDLVAACLIVIAPCQIRIDYVVLIALVY